MKRLLTNLLICGVAASAAGASVDVNIKISGRGSMFGTLEGRDAGFVTFRPKESSSVTKVADDKLTSIKFKLDAEMAPVKQQFDSGDYWAVAEVYSRILPPYLPYFGLPSNLEDEFPRWIISSYWAGDYSRTVSLGEALMPASEGAFRESVDFFSRLARMEQGGFGEMASFMKTSGAETLYPGNSAARLYIQARLLQNENRSVEAIRTITKLIARHSQDTDWMPKAELFCAELYFDLDMSESAEAVLADVEEFYSNTNIQNRAAALAAKQK